MGQNYRQSARKFANQFKATVTSIIDKGEAGEAILVLEGSNIEFCATINKRTTRRNQSVRLGFC